MAVVYGTRINDDTNFITTIDLDEETCETTGYIDGEAVDFSGGGGSSDFSTAQVTFDNQAGAQFLLSNAFDDDDVAASGPMVEGVRGVLNAILYKGMAYGVILDEGVTVTTTGAAEYDDGILVITGDCTITIS